MEHHGPTSWVAMLPLIPAVLKDPKLNYEHVNGALLVFLFLFVISLVAYLRIRNRMDEYLEPKPNFSFVGIVDMMIEALYKMVSSTLGNHAKEHFPFIATIFLFVFFSNLLGLLPMSSSPSANTNTTFALGICSFLYYNYTGIKAHGLKGYGKHFLMGMGVAGIPIAILELVSHTVRPLSLGVRLYVNMFVDHTLALSFQSLCAWLIPVPLLLFGVVVCTIQAFVFATLTAVYVQMATEH